MTQPETRNVFSMGGQTLAQFTKKGDKLIVAGASGVARVFTVGRDEQEPETFDILDEASDLAVSSSGKHFAVSSKMGEVELFSLIENKSLGKIIRSALPVRGIVFTHSDRMVAAAGDDDECQIGDLQDPEHIIKFKTGDQVHDISYNNKRDFAALTLASGEIKIFSISSEDPQLVKVLKNEVSGYIYQDDDEEAEDNVASARVEWHPDGNQLAIPCSTNIIKILDAKDDFKPVCTFTKHHEAPIVDLKWCPKGDFLASIDMKNRLLVWDAATRQPVVDEHLPTKVYNLSWCFKDGKYDLACGSENGDVLMFKDVVVEKKADVSEKSALDEIMGEDEAEDEDADGDADDIGLMSEMSDDGNDAGDDVRDFVDDDDGLLEEEGYTIPKKRPMDDGDDDADTELVREKRSRPTHFSSRHAPTFKIKPYSPGCTPYISERRYLTINSIGYVSSVRQEGHYSITVSFFDQSVHREYHFDDLYGYDLAALTSTGLLLGVSGEKTNTEAKILFRPHDAVSETWEKSIPTKTGELISSISLSDSNVLVCTSRGYIRQFSLFGIPMSIQKTAPVIACASSTNYIFTVSLSNNSTLIYNIQELDGRFVQRDLSLPIDMDVGTDLFRGVFFSTYGDPIVVGDDGVVLALTRWRSPLQARWVPIIDADVRVREIGGKGELKVWPLGLHGDNLNCIIIRGSNYPTYPLQLPSELEVRIPLSKEAPEDVEDPEEELVRAKTMGELLGETLSNEGETFEDDEERLNGYAVAHDRAVLKLIVQSCSEEKAAKAWKLAQELQQDKALAAAAKVAERVGLVALVNRINKLREQKMDQELESQTQS